MTQEKQPRRLAVYCRARCDNSDAIGFSLESQLSDCLEYAQQLRNDGQPLVFLEVQRGGSEPFEGRKRKLRPGLARLVEAIRAEEVEAVISLNWDRLFRSARLGLRFLRICRQHSVSVQIVKIGGAIPGLLEPLLEYLAAR